MQTQKLFFIIIAIHLLGVSLVTAQSTPDYSKLAYWAAHPEKEDPADRVPEPSVSFLEDDQKVDVFFVHPTTYTKGKPKENWNGNLQDEELNTKTLQGTILNQASIFNGAGKIYAPFYRQAHLYSYFTKDTVRAKQAFELAYQDVKAAFEYFLKYENKGRPIIMAAHSQGTNHTERLLKEYFDQDDKLRSRLVASYLVGMPIAKKTFENIPVCEIPNQTQCYCTWRTFKAEHTPKKRARGDDIAVTNPLSWTTSKEKVDKSLNNGSVLRKFDEGLIPNLVGAQVHDGVLWVNKPKFPGSFLLITKNYHIADFNLFYQSVRENSIDRVNSYHQKHNKQ